MYQDSRGFLWVGTVDHLVRFDGYTPVLYETEPGDTTSLSGYPVQCLYEDSTGMLWIGTLWNGLNKYNRFTDKFTRYQHDERDPASISGNCINAIYEDKDRNLWIGTSTGLNRFDREKNRFVCHKQDTGAVRSDRDVVRAIREDDSGVLWISTSRGLYLFDKTQKQFQSFEEFFGLGDVIKTESVSSCYQDASGTVWICAADGLYQLSRDPRQLFHYPILSPGSRRGRGGDIQAIADAGTFLWLGTTDGLYRFDKMRKSFTRYGHDPKNYLSLLENNITAILRDRGGCFWFGTAIKGINKRNSIRPYVKYYLPNPFDSGSIEDRIKSLSLSRSGIIWIGTDACGLVRYDKTTESFLVFQHDPSNSNSLSSNNVRCVVEDHDGIVWIGTADGLDKFDPTTRTFIHYRNDPHNLSSLSNNEVLSILEATNGSLYVGTQAGFNVFEPQTGRCVRYLNDPDNPTSISHNTVLAIHEDGDHSIWIGTRAGGLNRFDPASGCFTHFRNDPSHPHSISSNTVHAIYEFPYENRATLWLGTEGGGLCRFDKETEQFSMWTKKDGLPDNRVVAMAADRHGDLWLTTIKGITRFDPARKSFKTYEMSTELPVNPHACLIDLDGEVFFGGYRGLVRFFPDSMRDNDYQPDVVITDFKVNNKPARLDTVITESKALFLSYEQNTVAFEFAALDFNRPENNQYAYKMDGVNDDWVFTDATRRHAAYTNLGPGEYVFRVKGSNNDGVWNETGTSIAIFITPPWWKATWAYILYGVAAASVLYAAHRTRLNRQRLKHQLQLEHVEAGKLKEVDRLKSRFFSNISHEFRTPLTLILGPIEKMLGDPKEPRTDEALTMVRRNARKLLVLVSQLLDLSKVEAGTMRLEVQQGDVVPFVRRVVQSFQSWAERKRIGLGCECEAEGFTGCFDPGNVEKILNNLISNALKFTPEGGTVTVWVRVPVFSGGTMQSGSVAITVADSGPGISPEHLARIFDRFYRADESHKEEGAGIGLALVKELVELHHGTIRVESVVGEGSRFVLTIPIGREHYRFGEFADQAVSAMAPEPVVQASTTVQHAERAPAAGKEQNPIVLVVEDNDDVRSYIRGYLIKDYAVLEARDGVEGLEQARAAIPDLVVSDVMMPRIDGYELCRALKQDERTSHIPVILLTARAASESKIEGLTSGADDYLTKPFDAPELLTRISNLIEGRRLLREKWSKTVTVKPGEVAVTSLDDAFLNRVMASVEANMGREGYGVDDMAHDACLSRSQLHRKLVALTDLSPAEFTRHMRLLRARELLEKNAGTVSEVAESVGFSDPSHFAHAFEKEFGVLPSDVRRAHGNPTRS